MERCPDCDHLVEAHDEGGCWQTMTNLSTALIRYSSMTCPCLTQNAGHFNENFRNLLVG